MMNAKVLNFIVYQAGWFACVLGAAYGWPWLGTGLVIMALAMHVRAAPQPRAELTLILLAVLIGAVWDSALALSGVVHFANGSLIDSTAPHWMLALWALLASTLNLSLAWIKTNVWAAIALGGLGGPLAYLGGARAGALTLPDTALALPVLALGWAVLTPLLCALARRYNGYGASRTAPATLETHHA
jgi:hypothetical protein